MRNTYRYLAMAIGTFVVIQAAAIAFGMFGRRGKHVPQFFEAQRLLGREQDRFQYRFQFHARLNLLLCRGLAKNALH